MISDKADAGGMTSFAPLFHYGLRTTGYHKDTGGVDMKIKILDEAEWADIERLMDCVFWYRDENGLLCVNSQDLDTAQAFLDDRKILYEVM